MTPRTLPPLQLTIPNGGTLTLWIKYYPGNPFDPAEWDALSVTYTVDGRSIDLLPLFEYLSIFDLFEEGVWKHVDAVLESEKAPE